MLHLVAVQSDVGCECEGNDLEEGFHTKDCCDASIQSIDDLQSKAAKRTLHEPVHPPFTERPWLAYHSTTHA